VSDPGDRTGRGGPGPGDAEAVRAANAALYDAFEAGDIDLMTAVWLDGSAAETVTCGENMLTGMPSTAADPSPGLAGGRAVATNVFRRTSSGWRLWVHHASPVLTTQEADG
jgi:hypothetical protein